MKSTTVKNVTYESQKEFAEHLPKMLAAWYVLCNINFSKKDKEHFTVSYIRRDPN